MHAAKGYPADARHFAWACRRLVSDDELPRGAVVAVARVVECCRVEALVSSLSMLELSLGDFSPGRWAWLLDDVRSLRRPVECSGSLGVWRLPLGIEARVFLEL